MSLINFTNKINSVMDFEVDNDVMHLSVYFNDFSTNPIIDIFTFMRPFRRGHIAVFVVHWADLARERDAIKPHGLRRTVRPLYGTDLYMLTLLRGKGVDNYMPLHAIGGPYRFYKENCPACTN